MNRDTKILFFTPIVILPIILTSIPFFIYKNFPFWWAPQLFYSIACIITMMIFTIIIKYYKYSFQDFGWNKNFKWYDILLAIIFCIAGILLWIFTTFFLEKLDIVPWQINYIYQNKIFEIPIIIIFAVIIAPITEETLFRGFLIISISKKVNIWIAFLISLIVFALYHYTVFGLGSFILILIWGMLPTILFIWRKNIYISIIMHALNNLFAYIIQQFFFN